MMEEMYAGIAAFDSTFTYENSAELQDFPQNEDPVYILGEVYSTLYDLEDLKHDVLSKLWFTYRKGFSSIGGNGPVGDSGWGCMLRCGQMMLAQCLVNLHLGREWRWHADKPEPEYVKILKMFQDKKRACYSIQQIASMGVCEGKTVGQWFGPNTVAQVLKKLSIYDDWSSVAVHIAMDNTVIIDDIKFICKNEPPDHNTTLEGFNPNNSDKTVNLRFKSQSEQNIKQNGVSSQDKGDTYWKPLVLIIPLRLGLSEINSVYIESVKACFMLKQSAGIIGGKPNHAHWFIGTVADQLVYLDPHTTQPHVDLDESFRDESFHCAFASRMSVNQLDPSIAVCFFCKTEADFDMLCVGIRQNIIDRKKAPMFELHQERPKHWPKFEPFPQPQGTNTEFTVLDERSYDTDEEFELV